MEEVWQKRRDENIRHRVCRIGKDAKGQQEKNRLPLPILPEKEPIIPEAAGKKDFLLYCKKRKGDRLDETKAKKV